MKTYTEPDRGYIILVTIQASSLDGDILWLFKALQSAAAPSNHWERAERLTVDSISLQSGTIWDNLGQSGTIWDSRGIVWHPTTSHDHRREG